MGRHVVSLPKARVEKSSRGCCLSRCTKTRVGREEQTNCSELCISALPCSGKDRKPGQAKPSQVKPTSTTNRRVSHQCLLRTVDAFLGFPVPTSYPSRFHWCGSTSPVLRWELSSHLTRLFSSLPSSPCQYVDIHPDDTLASPQTTETPKGRHGIARPVNEDKLKDLKSWAFHYPGMLCSLEVVWIAYLRPPLQCPDFL